jgi:GNAT superfamily N-acetyltransferase
MPFCDLTMGARVERAERDLVASATAAVRRRVPDVFLAEIGGGVAAFTEPGSPLNKVVGLGFVPLDVAAWREIEAEHDRRGAPLQVELSTLASPEIGKLLTTRGHDLAGVENVSGRVLQRAASPPVGDVRIATCPAAALDRWIDAAVAGFATPDTQGLASHEHHDRAVLERVMRDFAAARGVVTFLAHRGGELAGSGSMRIDGTIAQLCGASTLPAHRRRGVQSALLSHRLAVAADAGCELCVVTTQPGSKSQQNVHRQGFELLYSRMIFVRPAVAERVSNVAPTPRAEPRP